MIKIMNHKEREEKKHYFLHKRVIFVQKYPKIGCILAFFWTNDNAIGRWLPTQFISVT